MLEMVKNESISVMEHICEVQGKIYELALQKGYSISGFSDAYLKSKFCKNEMDAVYSTWQYQDEDVCFEVIENEIGMIPSTKADKEYIGSVYWVGYMYRYLFYHSPYTSKQLAKMLPFGKMMWHSVTYEDYENNEAAEMIIAHKDDATTIIPIKEVRKVRAYNGNWYYANILLDRQNRECVNNVFGYCLLSKDGKRVLKSKADI